MTKSFMLEFDDEAADTLNSLMSRFGDNKPEKMISRAIGLLRTIEPLLDEEGGITVVDPNHNDEYVHVVFENAAKKAA